LVVFVVAVVVVEYGGEGAVLPAAAVAGGRLELLRIFDTWGGSEEPMFLFSFLVVETLLGFFMVCVSMTDVHVSLRRVGVDRLSLSVTLFPKWSVSNDSILFTYIYMYCKV
jgi:hypothetical protein